MPIASTDAMQDRIVQLRILVKTRLTYWNALEALEATLVGNKPLEDRQLTKIEDMVSNLAAYSDPDQINATDVTALLADLGLSLA